MRHADTLGWALWLPCQTGSEMVSHAGISKNVKTKSNLHTDMLPGVWNGMSPESVMIHHDCQDLSFSPQTRQQHETTGATASTSDTFNGYDIMLVGLGCFRIIRLKSLRVLMVQMGLARSKLIL